MNDQRPHDGIWLWEITLSVVLGVCAFVGAAAITTIIFSLERAP